MRRVLLLGVSSAFPRAESDPTCLVVEGGGDPAAQGDFIMLDCGGSPLQRLLAAGGDPGRLAGLFVTHTHPDHLGGFPLVVHGLRMLGRMAPLPVIGHHRSLASARQLMEALGLDSEKGFAIDWRDVPADRASSGRLGPFEFRSFPVQHSRPTLGIRLEENGHAVVYSSDTGPDGSAAAEARGAALLFHEMGALDDEEHPWHCSPRDLADIAANAAAGRVVIVHTPPLDWAEKARILAAIHARYDGPVEFGEAGSSYRW